MYTNSQLQRLYIERDYDRKALIQYNEGIRKSPPTKWQIANVKRILSDFGLKKIKIPDFDTYAELDRWRRNELRRLLSKEN